jgi:hypothetical protein
VAALKINRSTLDAARKENLRDIVEGFTMAVEDGRFDAYVVELEEALSLRMARLQGLEAPPPLKLPQRPPEAPPVAEERPSLSKGDVLHLKGEKYAGVTVEFAQHLADSPNHCRVLVVHAPLNQVAQGIEKGKYLRLPYAALVRIESSPKQSREVDWTSDIYDEPRDKVFLCKLCRDPISYSGTGRPKKFCDKCKDKPTAQRISQMDDMKRTKL